MYMHDMSTVDAQGVEVITITMSASLIYTQLKEYANFYRWAQCDEIVATFVVFLLQTTVLKQMINDVVEGKMGHVVRIYTQCKDGHASIAG